MSKYSLNADNFLRTLPEVLQDDPRMQALASAIANELETLAQKVQFAEIYTHIDDLDETMLDARQTLRWIGGDRMLRLLKSVLH